MTSTPRPQRRAVALPIVVVMIAIVGVFAVAFFSAGQGSYRQAAQAAYRLRLEQVVLSALDESRQRLFQLTSQRDTLRGNATLGPAVRGQILQTLVQANWDPSQLDLTIDLLGQGLLPNTQFISTAGYTGPPPTVTKAEAHFYGFRLINPMDPTGTFPLASDEAWDYYSNLLPFRDEPSEYALLDLVGYCTVTIEANQQAAGRTGGLRRKISVTHDVKVVDAKPPARQFALFSYRNTYGLAERQFGALNEGDGIMAIYAQSVGRIHVKGPYAMMIEGYTDGLGGGAPAFWGPSYPNAQKKWHGWSQVPAQRSLRLDPFRVFQSSQTRPEVTCLDANQWSATLGPGAGPTAVGDRAVFANNQTYYAAGGRRGSAAGRGQQRMYFTGEPQALNTADPLYNSGLGANAFRGPWMRFDDDQLDKWDIFVSDSQFSKQGETLDQVWIEPEAGGRKGIWAPVKYYRFTTEDRCSRSGVGDNVGGFLRDAVGFVVGGVSFGALEVHSYVRFPKDEPMVPSPEVSDLFTLAQGPVGPEDLEGDPATYMQPYALYFEGEETLDAINSLINLGVNALAIGLMFVPGIGPLLSVGLMVGLYAGSAIGQAALLPPNQGLGVVTDPNSATSSGVTSLASDAAIINQSTAMDPAVRDQLLQVPSTSMAALTRLADQPQLEAGSSPGYETLYQMITGDHRDPGGLRGLASGDALGLLRADNKLDARVPDTGEEEKTYATAGYLPPGLKSYMRLATMVAPDLQDLVPTADSVLELEGVIAVERLPQEQDNFTQDLNYVGKGMLFSYSRGDPDDPNRQPVIGGNILPQQAGRDYLTMVYWSGADPKTEATRGSHVGMLSLRQPRNEGTFVSPYGVNPLGPAVSIKGNLVTGLMERHRFEGGTALRVFYDWANLAPELGDQDPFDPVPYVAVSVSPKVAGWYDQVD